jgi:hypothetical protein
MNIRIDRSANSAASIRHAIGPWVLAAATALGLLASSPSSAQHVAPGTEMWANNNCLYVWNGSGWAPGIFCRASDSRSSSAVNLYAASDPQRRLLYRVQVGGDGWLYTYDYSSGATYALPNRGSWSRMFEGLNAGYMLGQDNQWHTVASVMAAMPSRQTPAPGSFIPRPDVFVFGGESPSSTPSSSPYRPTQADASNGMLDVLKQLKRSDNAAVESTYRLCQYSYHGC